MKLRMKTGVGVVLWRGGGGGGGGGGGAGGRAALESDVF